VQFGDERGGGIRTFYLKPNHDPSTKLLLKYYFACVSLSVEFQVRGQPNGRLRMLSDPH